MLTKEDLHLLSSQESLEVQLRDRKGRSDLHSKDLWMTRSGVCVFPYLDEILPEMLEPGKGRVHGRYYAIL